MTRRATPQPGVDRMMSTSWSERRWSSPAARQGRALARGLEGHLPLQHHHVSDQNRSSSRCRTSFSLAFKHGIYRECENSTFGQKRARSERFSAISELLIAQNRRKFRRRHRGNEDAPPRGRLPAQFHRRDLARMDRRKVCCLATRGFRLLTRILALQWDALAEAGCTKIFTEQLSGAVTDRPALRDALEFARSGDTLIVWKLARLARSMKQLIETIEKLRVKGIGFRSLTEALDTTTAQGRLVFHMFGALAEFERSLIRERTQAGLAAARRVGRTGGRPPKLTDDDIEAARAMLANPDIGVTQIAHRLGVSPATLYRYIPAARTANTSSQRKLAQDHIPAFASERGIAMTVLHLRRVDPARNMRRFYRLCQR
jgi:DNA invertase Pin-like site-specific DNA recombinase